MAMATSSESDTLQSGAIGATMNVNVVEAVPGVSIVEEDGVVNLADTASAHVNQSRVLAEHISLGGTPSPDTMTVAWHTDGPVGSAEVSERVCVCVSVCLCM